MKIEKVNDHQIRCTLTKADLADRQLKLSELAYGTEKAKDLFRDMMQQASAKFGFEAEDIPLMIEAIPLSGDCIVLIITKVEDPEELDTRFSKFAPSLHDGEEGLNDLPGDLNTDDEVLELFRRVQKSRQAKENKDDRVYIELFHAVGGNFPDSRFFLSGKGSRYLCGGKLQHREEISCAIHYHWTDYRCYGNFPSGGGGVRYGIPCQPEYSGGQQCSGFQYF